MPAKAKVVKLTDLIPDSRNANKGTVRGLAMLDDSLREDGAGRGILLDRQNNIIAGNKTLERAVDLGFEEVIIVPTDGKQLVATQRVDVDIDSPQGRRMGLRDNRVAQVDLEFDADVLKSLQDEGLDLSNLWNEDELAELLASVDDEPPGDPGAQVDRAAELQAKWQVSVGDVWQIGKHRLVCGDCTDRAVVESVMRGERAALMVNDPPYGMRLDADYSGMASKLRFARDKKAFGGRKYDDVTGDDQDYDAALILALFEYVVEQFWFGADYYSNTLGDTRHSGSWLVWDKRLDETMDKMYGSCFELIWSKQKHKRDILRFKWAGIFGVEQEQEHERSHPNQKPSPLIAEIVNRYSNDSAIVVDCYAGSGTTLVACEQTGRIGRGCEIEPKYCAVILERLAGMGLTPERVA